MEKKRGKGNKEGKIFIHSLLTFNLSCRKHNWKLHRVFLPLKTRRGFADQPEIKLKDSEGYIFVRKSPYLGLQLHVINSTVLYPICSIPVSCCWESNFIFSPLKQRLFFPFQMCSCPLTSNELCPHSDFCLFTLS